MLLKLMRVRWQALVLLILLFSITLGIVIGSATANIVPGSYASESSHTVSAQELAPSACDGMGLVNIVNLSEGEHPINANNLILGTSGNDTIKGKKGNDCIVGGGGDDTIDGKQGDDVILGGDGDDTIDGGKDNDICYGNNGTDTLTCETEYP